MKTIALAVMTAFLATSIATAAEARPSKKRKTVRHQGYAMAQPHSYGSERQRRNTYAYENGGYYERIQSAHVFGSRGWWDLQARGGGRR